MTVQLIWVEKFYWTAISQSEKKAPGRESGPFVVLGLAVRSWCCPRELAQAGGADCAWWPGAFALLGEGAISL